jgi:hypothetical protein
VNRLPSASIAKTVSHPSILFSPLSLLSGLSLSSPQMGIVRHGAEATYLKRASQVPCQPEKARFLWRYAGSNDCLINSGIITSAKNASETIRKQMPGLAE